MYVMEITIGFGIALMPRYYPSPMSEQTPGTSQTPVKLRTFFCFSYLAKSELTLEIFAKSPSKFSRLPLWTFGITPSPIIPRCHNFKTYGNNAQPKWRHQPFWYKQWSVSSNMYFIDYCFGWMHTLLSLFANVVLMSFHFWIYMKIW